MAPVFAAADLKTPVRDLLPMNAVVPILSRDGDYVNIAAGFVHQRHLAPETEKDFVARRRTLYWSALCLGRQDRGGAGLLRPDPDRAAGGWKSRAPRHRYDGERSLGERALAASEPLQRGDLVFWKGHMGVMLDNARLLHANAFHMMVAIEPLADAIPRIELVAGRVTSVKRL